MLRSANTQARQFRSILKEVTYHLGYEATASLNTRKVQISVSVGKESESEHIDCIGHKIDDKVCLIPILRSGLGMTDGMLELLPQAAVHHIGMYHVPGVAPVQYFNRLPRKCEADIAYIVDPVIGSAETALATIAILKKVRTFLLLFGVNRFFNGMPNLLIS
jgi:uracil phosphoribosyltransferase